MTNKPSQTKQTTVRSSEALSPQVKHDWSCDKYHMNCALGYLAWKWDPEWDVCGFVFQYTVVPTAVNRAGLTVDSLRHCVSTG